MHGLPIAAAVLCIVSVAGCGPMVQVATEPVGAGGAGPAEQLAVNLRLRTDAIEASISNLGEAPVDVLWDKATLVDTDDKTSGVVHSAAVSTGATSDLPGDVSRILPHATLTDFLIPARCVGFTPGEGWIVAPLLPVECGPIRCVGYHELVGKTVRLGLTMQVQGVERTFEWTLRITEAVRSVRGARPNDPNLH
jgi:hypothetical protein